MGKGVLTAVKNVNELIAPALIGMDPTKQVGRPSAAALARCPGSRLSGCAPLCLAALAARASAALVPFGGLLRGIHFSGGAAAAGVLFALDSSLPPVRIATFLS